MIALYILIGVGVIGVVTWFLLRKTLRTRIAIEKTIRDDPDINDWLVIFGWTPKVLYVPTIVASLAAAVLMFLKETQWGVFAGIDPKMIGGIWFAIFFLNFLVEEYDISIKLLLIGIVTAGFVFLWLNLCGWVVGFLKIFKHLAFSISGTGYLLVTLIGLLTIFISWFRGLFYYAAITPNYMNLQEGPTEAGEQIGREDYNSRIDTSDFLERLLGFGRIVITFKEKSRPPLILLVWRIQAKAQLLEKVRAKFAVDHPQQSTASAPL
jgi:hypothetical protein